jgi:hypothetical protein
MADQDSEHQDKREPKGFTAHSSNLASEYAREQGWGLNEEERTRTPREKQDYDGGRNYDYGARDFGDTAKDTSSAQPAAERKKARSIRQNRPRQKKPAA